MECRVYRCRKQDEMYIYLRADMEPDELPEMLQKRTGELTEIMQLTLSPDKKLARAKPEKVIASLEDVGFYLQMPPNSVQAHMTFGE